MYGLLSDDECYEKSCYIENDINLVLKKIEIFYQKIRKIWKFVW